jgi:putative transcription factor
MGDQFCDTRTFKKTAKPTPGATTCAPPAHKGRPDGQARKQSEIENETECFEVPTTGMSFAARLKAVRSQKEMTQKDLAQRASVKIDIIRDYENGKGQPDGKVIRRLEQILGTSLRDNPGKKK